MIWDIPNRRNKNGRLQCVVRSSKIVSLVCSYNACIPRLCSDTNLLGGMHGVSQPHSFILAVALIMHTILIWVFNCVLMHHQSVATLFGTWNTKITIPASNLGSRQLWYPSKIKTGMCPPGTQGQKRSISSKGARFVQNVSNNPTTLRNKSKPINYSDVILALHVDPSLWHFLSIN